MSGKVEIVRAERLVAGGAALSRRDDGQIVLVDGALPDELVEVTVERRHGTERGTVVRVVELSPARIEPRCPHVAEGCGGCDLPALAHAAQVGAKVELVTDSLRRLGRWREPVVHAGPPLDPWGFRTTLRLAVTNGRAGLRRAASNDVVTLEHCLVAHPLLDELVAEGTFGSASYVTLRVGTATGERLALVAPTRDGVSLPDDVRVVGADELTAGAVAFVHDDAAGRRWRISAASFFQTRTDGADALVDVVRAMAGDVLERERGVLVDAYSGVGLFAGALLAGPGGPRTGWRAVTAESDHSSVEDARANLADLDARIVETSVERFKAPRADLVVADPSRAGLGTDGAAVVASTRATRVVLVSCDPAAAGRDAGILKARGYRPIESTVVDLFPHTHHVEVVTRFDRTS